MTRVAVVIPCFNDGATIGETVASLAGEEPHELVVVDDGSTDPETLRVLDELETSGVRVVHQVNGGLSSARMAGVRETRAPYVFPLDADDLIAPGALAALADALDAIPAAAVAWGDLRVFGRYEQDVPSTDALDPWAITYLTEIPGTSMLRRTSLEEAGGWSLGAGYEDWDLWMSLAERGWEGVHVPRLVLRVRQHEGRLNRAWLEQHGRHIGALRERHPELFDCRAANRRASAAPLRAKLLFPLIERLAFLSAHDRYRLTRLVNHPVRMLRGRRRRLHVGA